MKNYFICLRSLVTRHETEFCILIHASFDRKTLQLNQSLTNSLSWLSPTEEKQNHKKFWASFLAKMLD